MTRDLIQIVDENDLPVGVATRNDAQERGLLHRIVKVFIEDGKGFVLLQRRASTVQLYPNCWDYAAAGHVDAGEDYETAAKRELLEELGVEGVVLDEVNYFRGQRKVDEKILNRFYKVYKAVVQREYPFKLQAEEVGAVQWFTIDEVARLIREHPDEATSSLRDLAETWQ